MNRLIKKYYLLAVVMGLGGLVIAGAVNLVARPVYQAEAVIRINKVGTSFLNDGQSPGGEASSGFKIGTYEEILKSRSVLDAVLVKARMDNQALTYENLSDSIRARPVREPGMLLVTARGDTPEQAQELAGILLAEFTDRLIYWERTGQTAASELIGPPLPAARRELAPAEVVQVIEPPVASQIPIGPDRTANLVLGAVAGLLAGIGTAWAWEYTRRVIYGPHEVKRYLGLPVLGVIPGYIADYNINRPSFFPRRVRRKNYRVINPPGVALPAGTVPNNTHSLIVHEQGRSAAAEAYRRLRMNIQYAEPNERLRIIMITSSLSGEGKSVTAANVAAALAQAGYKTVIADCDLRQPAQHLIFGRVADGLTNVLARERPLAAVLQATEVKNLTLLASGPRPDNPAAMLTAPAMDKVVGYLAVRYDYVIVDTPPVLVVPDSCRLAFRADGIVMVLGAGTARAGEVRLARELLANVQGHVIGVAVNRVAVPGEQNYRCYYRTGLRPTFCSR